MFLNYYRTEQCLFCHIANCCLTSMKWKKHSPYWFRYKLHMKRILSRFLYSSEQILSVCSTIGRKSGRVMDGPSDRLSRLVGGLCPWISDTFYLVIHPIPRSKLVSPTSCLWPLIIARPLLAMCWESKGSHLSLIRKEKPTISCSVH